MKLYSRKRIFGTETEFGTVPPNIESQTKLDEFEGRFLNNGSYVYVDCDHLEYASPECSNPLDAVLYDKAGETIVQRIMPTAKFYKNNIDSRGKVFGAHENYFIHAGINERLMQLLPFLVTRQIFTGSGGLTWDGEYTITQRSNSIRKPFSLSSTSGRGIINNRDESHADNLGWNRMHLIFGDANMCEVAEYLKLGTTGLVLDLYEDDKLPRIGYRNQDNAVKDLHVINSEASGWKTRLRNGMPAVEVQRLYLKAAKNKYSGRDAVTDDLISRWTTVIDELEKDPKKLFGSIDWVTKKVLIDTYAKKHMICTDYGNDLLKNIDLQYHDIDRSKGLFYHLQSQGLTERVVSDEEIAFAVNNPPDDTRARYRGILVAKYGPKALKVSRTWNSLTVPSPKGNARSLRRKTKEMAMDNPFDSYDRRCDRVLNNMKKKIVDRPKRLIEVRNGS